MGGNGNGRSLPPEHGAAHGVGAFLADSGLGERIEIRSLRRLRGGAVQENLALDVDIRDGPGAGRHRLVVRADPARPLAAGLPRSAEFAVLQAARAAGLPVPAPRWLCEDERYLGRPFLIMDRLPGEAAAHRLVRDPRLEGAGGEALLARLGAELARLHRIRPPFPGLEALGEPPDSPALARVAECRRALDRLPEPQPTLEWGLRWLERHAPRDEEVALCHGDFRTGNYLVEDGALTGILDWAFAGWGDPLEDLGWFCARCWRCGRFDRPAGGIGPREVLYGAYEAQSGVALERGALPYWEVMATVRWAVLALAQAERYRRGDGPALELALTGRMVPELELDLLDQLDAIREGRAPC